eukprot:TRINITY_DN47184_c0_g1_i1.p2 TRINITY_DN47184_c0_g1~~TRINITY_DN47184_c0_g1_i1.p2  ORF type:complete len:338 (+),score=139.72 TRINITY_DN47184_c0_g1_i1:76-1014(+)
MAFAMDASAYDKVSAYTSSKARKDFRKAGHAVMAANRLMEAMSLPGTSRRGNPVMDRAAEKARRARAEADKVTDDHVVSSLRRNSSLSKQMLRQRSSSITDISKSKDQMVWCKAWYLNTEGQTSVLTSGAGYPNRRDSSHGQVWVSQEQLEDVGLVFMRMPLTSLAPLDELVRDRGYCSNDEVVGEGIDPQLEQMLYREHFNRSEIIMHVKEGECFADVRDKRDNWVRLNLKPGDLIVIPPGACHRVALSAARAVRLQRFFRATEPPLWEPVYRTDAGADGDEVRVQYVSSRRRGSVCEDNGFARGVEEDLA